MEVCYRKCQPGTIYKKRKKDMTHISNPMLKENALALSQEVNE